MVQLYLCDDNPVILEAYRELCGEIARGHALDVHISTFCSGSQLLFFYEDAGEKP